MNEWMCADRRSLRGVEIGMVNVKKYVKRKEMK